MNQVIHAIGTSNNWENNINFGLRLRPVNMKIVLVATVVFGSLAALFYSYRFFSCQKLPAKQLNPPPVIEDENDLEQAKSPQNKPKKDGLLTHDERAESMTKEELFKKCIDLEQAKSLQNKPGGGCVLIHHERPESMTKEELLKKCIELNPEYAAAYLELARIIKDSTYLNGQLLTVQELYVKSIELDPYSAKAYYHLANTLSDDQSVIICGKFFRKADLLRKCVELDPSFAPPYL